MALTIPINSRTADELTRAACEYGPLATRRKRLAVACRCAAHLAHSGADPRVHRLLDAARAYCGGTAPLDSIAAALREADAATAELSRDATRDVWSIFEGLRAGGAADAARRARAVTDGVRWALQTGGRAPTIPAGWNWLRGAAAECRPPVCDPNWRTADVLTLARLVQNGDTSLLPILADALQDAGCDDDRVLDHCRSAAPHTRGCWVPDLVLDGG